jgi:energy-coupling factor transporter ATP-binding protein EcfA2
MKASEHPSIIQFQRALRNLSLDPLITDREVERFGVEYGGATLARLDSLIRDSDAQDSKIMFTGHTGCGKSTLLAALARQLQDDYFVTRFSIAEMSDRSSVNHVEILFAIGINLLRSASLEGIVIPPATAKSFANWFSRYTKTESDINTFKGEIGLDFWKIIVLKIGTEKTIREDIRKEFEPNINDLVAKLNEIAATIQMVSKKKSLVIIDDLDKLDMSVARKIFQDNIKSLFLPNFAIIYTLPIAALRDTRIMSVLTTETDDGITEMAVSKIYARGDRLKGDDQYQTAVVEKLAEVLRKRLTDELIKVEEIMEPEVINKIALASGGVLRELIRIVVRCCRICLTEIRQDLSRNDIKITVNIFAEAFKDMRLDFERPLGESDYQILERVGNSNLPKDVQQQEFLTLLHGLYILEYRNDDVWYDLHPIVIDLMRRKQIIT